MSALNFEQSEKQKQVISSLERGEINMLKSHSALNKVMRFLTTEVLAKLDWKASVRSLIGQIIQPVDKLFLVTGAILAFFAVLEILGVGGQVVASVISTAGHWNGLHLLMFRLLAWGISIISIIAAVVLWGQRSFKRLLSLFRPSMKTKTLKGEWGFLMMAIACQVFIVLSPYMR